VSKLDRYAPHALAALRIMTSLLMIQHATMKFFAFPGPLPMPGPLPGIIVAAGVIELVTGTLILLGLFTRPAAFLASGTMAAAYFLGHATQGFWPALNQGEAAIMFCFAFFVLIFTGPGAWSLDGLRRNKTTA
jgi:putative oxidoreductase